MEQEKKEEEEKEKKYNKRKMIIYGFQDQNKWPNENSLFLD